MSIGRTECPQFDSPSNCWNADGSRGCDRACDCMCHWSFDQLRLAIARLSVVATWALNARSMLSAAVASGANGGDALTEMPEVLEVIDCESPCQCDSVETKRLHSPNS